MDWFALLFLLAAAIALVTGRAWFRGTIARRDDPRRYWSTVGCYVALAAGSLLFSSRPHAFPMALVTDFMTDAATRLARDLRDGADRLAASRGETLTVAHRMQASPEGCAHGYRAQLTAASSIVVWCRSDDGQRTLSSHSTTSHLPAVDVPQTWIVDKPAGATLYVELARTGGKPAVARVY